MWVASEFGGSVARIDPATDTVAGTIKVGNRPRGLAVAGGLVWVGAQASATSHRGGTLTVLQNGPFGSSDPAANVFSLATVLTLYMTNDGLTAFKRVGGSDGEQVVPDLATSLPAPTDGGRTYTFQLRPRHPLLERPAGQARGLPPCARARLQAGHPTHARLLREYRRCRRVRRAPGAL